MHFQWKEKHQKESEVKLKEKPLGLDLLDKQTNSAKNTTVCGLICEIVPID